MAPPALLSALLRASVLSREAAAEAERRQGLYGGSLDTVLLEISAAPETALVEHMAQLAGIPALDCDRVLTVDAGADQWLDVRAAQSLGVVPIGRRPDALELAARPGFDHDALVAWAAQRSLLVEPHQVTEVRFRGLLGRIYGIPVPPRFLVLLGRLMGLPEVRRWLQRPRESQPGGLAQTAPEPNRATDAVETLLQLAELGDEEARRAACQALGRHLRDQRVAAHAKALQTRAALDDPTIAKAAINALAQLRDPTAMPVLIGRLESDDGDIAETAHAALVALTCDDLGRKRKRWVHWWERMSSRPRVEWLLEALANRNPEIRLAASQELHDLTGEYFGYHYDLPERDREEARRRWQHWWTTVGKRRD
jgi:hypothetical protein